MANLSDLAHLAHLFSTWERRTGRGEREGAGVIAEAPPPTDWPSIIAAIFAGLFGLVNLIYTLQAKARAEAAAKEIKDSREERSGQIDKLQENVGALREEVRGHADAANHYSDKIAQTSQATQAVAEEVKQMRQELNSQPRNDH